MCASKLHPSRIRPGRVPALFLSVAFWVLAFGMCLPPAAQAQSKKDQEQVRRLRQQVQQLQQEQASQQAAAAKAAQDKAAAETELKKAQEEAGAVRASASRRAASLSRELQAATSERDALQAKLAETQAQLDKTTAALALSRSKLAERDEQWTRLDADHKTQSATLAACQAHNVELYKLGSELLTRYQNKGLGEVFATGEPFTQIKRVELENLVEGYRDKLDRERQPAAPGSPPIR